MTQRTQAILSSLIILVLAVGVGLWRYSGARPKPIVESRRIDTPSGGPTAVPIGPTAREALERRAELRLTDAQISRLMALDREWKKTVGPLESEAREAGAEFQRFMKEAQRAGRANLAAIQRRVAEEGGLFATYRAQRAAHAAAVRQVLTEDQRARWTSITASRKAGEER